MFLVEFADVWFVSALAVLWLAAISPLVALIVAYLKGLKVAFYAVSSYLVYWSSPGFSCCKEA